MSTCIWAGFAGSIKPDFHGLYGIKKGLGPRNLKLHAKPAPGMVVADDTHHGSCCGARLGNPTNIGYLYPLGISQHRPSILNVDCSSCEKGPVFMKACGEPAIGYVGTRSEGITPPDTVML